MTITILQADARKIPLADASVDCIVTSPPYWGLRDYGVEGQIGLEETFDEWLRHMVQEVAAEWWRVLKPTGTLWVNMGDSYAGSWGNYGGQNRGNGTQRPINTGSDCPNPAYDGQERRIPPAARIGRAGKSGNKGNKGDKGNTFDDGHGFDAVSGLKPKDLIGQPWRLAFALQAAGWWLRSDIIWHKPAPMPESCRDRPTKAHEYIFLLSKSEHYYFDQAAWLEPCSGNAHPRGDGLNPKAMENAEGSRQNASFAAATARKSDKQRGHSRRHAGFNDRWDQMEREEQITGKRNRRTVWTVASQPTSEAHFATFPEALVEPCLLAGCPRHVCSACGVPWEPVEEKSGGSTGESWHGHDDDENGQKVHDQRAKGGAGYRRELKGYQPQCKCAAPSKPGTVFDPFGGSGTTMVVANRMGLNGVMTELNPKYIEIARRRIFADVEPTPAERKNGQKLVFA